MFKKTLILMATLGLTVAPFQIKAIFPSQNKQPIVKERVNRIPDKTKIPYGGTLVIGDSNSSPFINPILIHHGVSIAVSGLVFSSLVRFNFLDELEGDLAESWEISPNRLEYTFHLKKGVRFHDKVELTSEDVQYTYQTIKEHGSGSPYSSAMENVLTFSSPDKYTFRVVLKEPYAPLINEFIREIVPKHLYEGTDIYSNAFNYKPIGTGPFLFKEWVGNKIVLETNKDYFAGRPYLDRIVFNTYKDRKEVWSAFMRGEIDLIRFMSVEDYELTKKDASFHTYAVPIYNYYVVSWNLSDPVLADKSIRRAIAYAIDRGQLIQKVEKGYGLECNGPFRPDSWAFNADIQPIGYDPAEASRLLKQAGWKDTNGDGMLEKDGKELVIKMLVESKYDETRKNAMLIRQQLQEVGIRLQVLLYRNNAEIDKYMESEEPQAHLTVFFANTTDPNDVAKLWYSQDRRGSKVWVGKQSGYGLDKLIASGQIATDRHVRQGIYRELHKMIYEEQYACFLYFPYVFHAVSKSVGNADKFLDSPFMSEYVIKDFYVKDNKKGGDG